jgi:hypothetical protein
LGTLSFDPILPVASVPAPALQINGVRPSGHFVVRRRLGFQLAEKMPAVVLFMHVYLDDLALIQLYASRTANDMENISVVAKRRDRDSTHIRGGDVRVFDVVSCVIDKNGDVVDMWLSFMLGLLAVALSLLLFAVLYVLPRVVQPLVIVMLALLDLMHPTVLPALMSMLLAFEMPAVLAILLFHGCTPIQL